MQLPDFAKDPKPVLEFLVGAAGLIALFPALGGEITHKEAEIIAWVLGVLALLSGAIALVSAIRDWNAAGGTPADRNRAGLALVVLAIGCMLVFLGARAAFAVSHSIAPHQVKSDAYTYGLAGSSSGGPLHTSQQTRDATTLVSRLGYLESPLIGDDFRLSP